MIAWPLDKNDDRSRAEPCRLSHPPIKRATGSLWERECWVNGSGQECAPSATVLRTLDELSANRRAIYFATDLWARPESTYNDCKAIGQSCATAEAGAAVQGGGTGLRFVQGVGTGWSLREAALRRTTPRTTPQSA